MGVLSMEDLGMGALGAEKKVSAWGAVRSIFAPWTVAPELIEAKGAAKAMQTKAKTELEAERARTEQARAEQIREAARQEKERAVRLAAARGQYQARAQVVQALSQRVRGAASAITQLYARSPNLSPDYGQTAASYEDAMGTIMSEAMSAPVDPNDENQLYAAAQILQAAEAALGEIAGELGTVQKQAQAEIRALEVQRQEQARLTQEQEFVQRRMEYEAGLRSQEDARRRREQDEAARIAAQRAADEQRLRDFYRQAGVPWA